MKVRKTFLSVAFSVLIIFAAAAFFLMYETGPAGAEFLSDILSNLDFGSSGITVTAGSIDRNFIFGITLRDVSAEINDERVVSIPSVRISVGLADIFRMALGHGNPQNIIVGVGRADINITDNTVESIMRLVSSGGENSGAGETSYVSYAADTGDAETENSVSDNLISALKEASCNINFSDVTVNASVSQGELRVSGLAFSASFGKDLSPRLITADIRSMGGFLAPGATEIFPDGTAFEFTRIRATADSSMQISLSVSRVHIPETAVLGWVSAAGAVYEDGSVLGALELGSGQVSYLGAEASFTGLSAKISTYTDFRTAEADLDISGLKASYGAFSVNSSRAAFSLLSGGGEDTNVNFSLDDLAFRNAGMSGSAAVPDVLNTTELFNAVDVYGAASGTNVSKSGKDTEKPGNSGIPNADAKNISGFVNIRQDVSGIWGRAGFGRLSLAEGAELALSDGFVLTGAVLENVSAGFSVSGGNYSANIDARVSGQSSSELAPFFSGYMSISARVDGLTEKLDRIKKIGINENGPALTDIDLIDSLELDIAELALSTLPSSAGSNSLHLAVSEGRAEADFDLGGALYGGVIFTPDTLDTEARLYFSDFRPETYRKIVRNFLPVIYDYAGENTVLDGSITALGTLDMENPSGRVSLNLAGNNVRAGGTDLSAGITLEGTLENHTANVETFAVSALGLRLSYSGTIDTGTLFPQGSLELRNAGNGNRLAGISFTLDEGGKSYSYIFTAALLGESVLAGTVDWNTENMIHSVALFETEGRELPMELTIITDEPRIILESEQLSINAGLDGKTASGTASANGLALHLSERLVLRATADIDGTYSMDSGAFRLEASGVKAVMSDVISAGFGFISLESPDSDSSRIQVKDFEAVFRDAVYRFEGDAEISFPHFAGLLSGDTDGAYANGSFTRPGYSDSVDFILTENSYRVKALLTLPVLSGNFEFSTDILGERNSGFYAQCRAGEFDFEARYIGRYLHLYSGRALLGTVEVSRFDLTLDIENMVLQGTVSAQNMMHNFEGDVTQGGTLDIRASLEPSSSGAVSFADPVLSFDIDIRDSYLGDGFKIADTSFNALYSGGTVTLTGDLINGSLDIPESRFEIDIKKEFLFGLHARGSLGSEVDIMVDSIYFPVPIINQFINFPQYHALAGEVEGSLLIKGPSYDPSFYGMLYAQSYAMDIFWAPDQILTLKSTVITLTDHTIRITPTPAGAHSTLDNRFFDFDFSITLEIHRLSLAGMEMILDIYDRPMDFWLPIYFGPKSTINIRGDVAGIMNFYVRNGVFGIDANLAATDFSVGFRLPDNMPDWFYDVVVFCSTDISLTMGKNVEFFYPDRDDSFMNFTFNEGEKIRFMYDSVTNDMGVEGSLSFKTGRIYYFQNDFYITDGSLRLSKPVAGSDAAIDMSLDLTAKLREYDSDGNRLDIYLILQNASFDNINPRFESSSNLTQKEIIDILGQAVIPAEGETFSFSSLASLTALATDTISKLGIIELGRNYSLTGSVRQALGLDMFSARSAIVQNILIEALPGQESNVSLLSRYLNGTSVYAGKYITDNLFARLTLLLKSAKRAGAKRESGHFLTDDLNLDIEFSVEWENPIGMFSLFTQPQELSVLNILDTIGFSFTKRISI